MSAPGRLIVFEGVDGAGKTSCMEAARECLLKHRAQCQLMREPGGSFLGERLRELLLHGEPGLITDNKTELLLFYAARLENLHLIRKMLEQGVWVISDRFNDSTFAYQSFDGSVSEQEIAALDQMCLQEFAPDLVILLDIDVSMVQERLNSQARSAPQARDDRFHTRKGRHYQHLVSIYRQRATSLPDNHICVDARLPIETVAANVVQAIEERYFSS